MKKFLSLISIVALLAIFAVPAMAGGSIDMHVGAYESVLDLDGKVIHNGAAGGISGAVGSGNANAAGGTWWGKVEGDVVATGGGLTDTNSYKINNPIKKVTHSVGVGSFSQSEAITGATAAIGALGLSRVCADINGFASQGTLNGSALINGSGFTGGISGQGALGGFSGGAIAIGKGKANIGANIDMWGNSYSESYRFTNIRKDFTTKGMGTNVGASTNVVSSGYENTCGLARANVDGGWMVAGGVSTITVQNVPGGGAIALATGSYSGHGSLGTNYNGSAVGYSGTSVTTYNGMNGSINTSSAGMSVTSTVTR